MSNKFSTSGKEGMESAPSKWIQAPCVANARIASARYIESSRKKSPGLELIHLIEDEQASEIELYDGGPKAKGQMAKTTLWLSDKAFERSQNVIILLANRLGKKEELDKATAGVSSEKEFADAAAKVIQGLEGAFIFGAEEVWLENDDGTFNCWMKPVMNTSGSFARPHAKSSELLERFEKRGADAFIRKSEKPQSTVGGNDAEEDADW